MCDRLMRMRALLEVLVVFVSALGAVALVARSPLAHWQRGMTLRPFAEYLALGLVPLAAILLTRLPFPSFGITLRDLSGQLDASLKCLLPFALGRALVFLLGPRNALHSIAEPVIAVGVIAAWAWLLPQRPSTGLAAIALLGLALPNFSPSALLFYPLFLAPAEELLFRGFIQSRLNLAFGCRYKTAGAAVGAGLFITAAMFSVFHIINLPALVSGRMDPLWVTALPSFAWGLAFGYLRERTGSLLAPTVVHGVPQAIAWTLLGR